ncbi:MAG: recombinase family protein [Pseudomonadales bacterium]|nr:recombinase family protein [Pseudomonadales bacterium]
MNGNGKRVRCAIYTRKSTEEGLEQDFNSLDAQRESAENYIASQKAEGWVCLPDRYDDGGFTGGNMDRPAVQRLMADIEADRVDCVVVYKVDRLSRSLLDFAKLMEVFERHKVSFVSVTQQFNTTHSMGRLTLNILLSFAQFEREIISERTRDKIAAARRKGKWSGGPPVLGYDILREPGGSKLIVNAEEAERVRYIFGLYLECASVSATIRRLDELGWVNKVWTTKQGRQRGGKPFDKSTLFNLLTNVVYRGQIAYHDQLYAGEQDAIVDEDLFRRVQAQLRINRNSGGKYARNKYGALLKGLVRCTSCGCAMSHHFATRGNKRYRYYVCVNAQKRGWDKCPAPSLPAAELEQFVVDQIRALGQDDGVILDAVRAAQEHLRQEAAALQEARKTAERRVTRLTEQMQRLAAEGRRADQAERLAELQDRLRDAEQRVTELDDQIVRADKRLIDEDELVGAIEAFDPVWDALNPRERERIVRLLVAQVAYDASQEAISVTFNPTGIAALSNDEEAACTMAG